MQVKIRTGISNEEGGGSWEMMDAVMMGVMKSCFVEMTLPQLIWEMDIKTGNDKNWC